MLFRSDDHMAEQIVKQLHKLIDTIKVVDLTVGSHIERELMLVKIKATDNDIRTELKSCVDRKSTRLNSSHGYISYAVFCLKKKKKKRKKKKKKKRKKKKKKDSKAIQ